MNHFEDPKWLCVNLSACDVDHLTLALQEYQEPTAPSSTSQYLYNAANSPSQFVLKGTLAAGVRRTGNPPSKLKKDLKVRNQADGGNQFADCFATAPEALETLHKKLDNACSSLPPHGAAYYKYHTKNYIRWRLYVGTFREGIDDESTRRDLWAYFEKPKDDKTKAPPMVIRSFRKDVSAPLKPTALLIHACVIR
jgi:hypothetical protein